MLGVTSVVLIVLAQDPGALAVTGIEKVQLLEPGTVAPTIKTWDGLVLTVAPQLLVATPATVI